MNTLMIQDPINKSGQSFHPRLKNKNGIKNPINGVPMSLKYEAEIVFHVFCHAEN